MKHKPDKNSVKIQQWIRGRTRGRANQLREFLRGEAAEAHGLTHVLHGNSAAALRRKIVTTFNLK